MTKVILGDALNHLNYSEKFAMDYVALARNPEFTANFLNALAEQVHQNNVDAGWWTDLLTGESILHTRNVGEMLMLVTTEVSEGMEGHRKNRMDDKLTHRPMLVTELSDAVIRILDLAGSRVAIERENQLPTNPIGTVLIEKLAFNKTREDHKIENRQKADGKKI